MAEKKSKKPVKGKSLKKASSSKKAPSRKGVVKKTVIKLSGGKGNKPIKVSTRTTVSTKGKRVGFFKGLLNQVKGIFSPAPKKKRG